MINEYDEFDYLVDCIEKDNQRERELYEEIRRWVEEEDNDENND